MWCQQSKRTEVEGGRDIAGSSNPENGVRIKIRESKVGHTLMTREHNKKKAVSEPCLASHSSHLQKKEGKNSHRDKRRIGGLLPSDGLDMT